jgi:hypothetical protein
MIRKPIQCAFVFILCPLLAAQQTSQPVSPSEATPQTEQEKRYVILPSDTNIELLPPGPSTFAGANASSLVRFAVDKDVVLGGVLIVHAGVPVVGVVDHVKRGSHFKHRATEMEIRVTEMISGRPIELHLRCFDQGDQSVSSYSRQDRGPGLGPIGWAVIIAVVLGLLALWGGDK